MVALTGDDRRSAGCVLGDGAARRWEEAREDSVVEPQAQRGPGRGTARRPRTAAVGKVTHRNPAGTDGRSQWGAARRG